MPTIDPHGRAELVAAAMPLLPRLERPWLPASDAGDTRAGLARVKAWGDALGADGSTALARRWSWSGWSAEHARRVLMADTRALPLHDGDGSTWLPWLERAYGRSDAECQQSFLGVTDDAERCLRAEYPVPFEALLVPLVEAARRALAVRTGAALAHWSVDALVSLERQLLLRLSRVATSWCLADFAAYRALGGAPSGEGRGNGLFNRWLAQQASGRWWRLLAQFPVGARLLGTVTGLWVDAMAELITRFDADRTALADFLSVDEPPVVDSVETDLGDPHDGGRAVAILRLNRGRRVVYKPRDLGFEVLFAELLHMLKTRDPDVDLRAAPALSRAGYGWLAFVTAEPVTSAAAVSRFYARCGMLLCLSYATNATDFHYENLIAHGEHPVLIDMESLLGPRFSLVADLPTPALVAGGAAAAWQRSVLAVRMLPTLKVDELGLAEEVGALEVRPRAKAMLVPGLGWADINADGMRRVRIMATARDTARNVPDLDGVPQMADAHIDAICDGFARMYRALCDERGAALAPDRLRARVQSLTARFILRNTGLYVAMLDRVLHPSFLRDGRDRSVALDALARALLRLDGRPEVWQLLAAEHEALEQMDVPLFRAPAGERCVLLPDGTRVEDVFQASPIDEMIDRLAMFDASDLEFQLAAIRGTFAAHARDGLAARPVPAAASTTAPAIPDSPRAASRPIPSDLALAHAVARDLMEKGFRTDGGEELSWFTPTYQPAARRYVLGPSSLSLLDGYGGTSVFLAAVAHVSGDSQLATAARDGLRPLTRGIADLERAVRFRHLIDLGIGTGLSSATYALVRAGMLLPASDLLDHAARASRLLDPARAANCAASDLVSGIAGAIPALLAVSAATGDHEALSAAIGFGRVLGERAAHARASDGGGGHYWNARDAQRAHGLAHGDAGIAMALVRLGRTVADEAMVREGTTCLRAHTSTASAAWSQALAFERAEPWSAGVTGMLLAYRDAIHDSVSGEGACMSEGLDTLCTAPDVEDLSLAAGLAGRVALLQALASRRDAVVASLHDEALDVLRRRLAADMGRHGRLVPSSLYLDRLGAAYVLLRATVPELPCLARFH